MSTLRTIAARVVPDAAKRRHEVWSTRRFHRSIEPLNRQYVREHGFEVQRGPFAGTRYEAGLVEGSGDAVAKLVGTYEQELSGVIEAWIEDGWERVVNVGAAEGFYAVGLARAMPDTEVLAYDIDSAARDRCSGLAELNGVRERVVVRGECTPAELQSLPPRRTALLCDCEGYEATLLDPSVAPVLGTWDVLVELHEFLVPGIADTIAGRFATTHEVRVIEGESRVGVVPPELAALSPEQRELLLGERRPGPMRWAHLRPR